MKGKKGMLIASCLVLCSSFVSSFPLITIAQEQATEQIELKVLKNEQIISDSFRVGQDEYVTGEILSSAIKKVELHVNHQRVQGGIIYNDNSFEIEAKDAIQKVADKVEVVGLDRKGNELSRQIVALEQAEIILSAADYTMFDEAITGIAGNKMDEVSLLIDGEIIETVKVKVDQTYRIPVDSRDITSVDDHVEIVGSVAGKELGRIPVALNPIGLESEIPSYTLGKDQKVLGKLSGKDLAKAKKVRLFVNRKRYTTVDIKSDGTFEIESTVFITDIKDNVQISVLNEKENEIGRYQVTVISEEKPINEWFPDPALAKIVAERLREDVEKKVSEERLLLINSIFTIYNSEVNSLQGMQYLKNIDSLRTNCPQVSDLSPISNLTNLEVITIEEDSNLISDISALKKLTNLESIYLGASQISDLSPLSNLFNLKHLYLEYNSISDLSSLSELFNLETLGVYGNSIRDISSLSRLNKLTYLDLKDSQIQDISPLSNLSSLRKLYLSNNQISDIHSLNKLPNLTELSLKDNQISDISSLSNLAELDYLQLDGNQIKDITPLVNKPDLRNGSVRNQQIKLENKTIATDNQLTLKNPVIGMTDGSFNLSKISDNGSYFPETNLLHWKNLSDNGETSYNFEFVSNNFIFNGTVTIPYSKK